MVQWVMAHPWMTLALIALGLCVVDNIAANVCRVVVALAERRESKKEKPARDGVVWHDAKTDPPKIPGRYYGKDDDANHMYPVTYRNGVWVLEAYPQTEMDILRWAEMTDFVEAENED